MRKNIQGCFNLYQQNEICHRNLLHKPCTLFLSNVFNCLQKLFETWLKYIRKYNFKKHSRNSVLTNDLRFSQVQNNYVIRVTSYIEIKRAINGQKKTKASFFKLIPMNVTLLFSIGDFLFFLKVFLHKMHLLNKNKIIFVQYSVLL